jgi:hypothetical protein
VLYGFNLWLVLKNILPHAKLKPFEKTAWALLLQAVPLIGLWIYTLAGWPGTNGLVNSANL